MGIKNTIRRLGIKGADAVAKLSVLSPEQLGQVEAKRQAYLFEMPDMDGDAAKELTQRLLAAGSIEIYNEYLQHLQDLYAPVERKAEYGADFSTAYNIRYINITRWVTDKKENSLEKLVNVYEVLSKEECNIALVFHRTMEGTEVYLAVTNTRNAQDNVDAENYRRRLVDAIRGNFPGAQLSQERGKGIIPCMKADRPYSVAVASNVPGEKSEKFVSQTIEKLLDGIVPDDPGREYTIVLLATPVQDVEDKKTHLADLYTALAPYAGWQTDFTYSQSDSTNSTATFGINAGVSAGVQAGQNSSMSKTKGETETNTSSETDSTGSSNTTSAGSSTTHSTGSSTTNTTGTSTGETTGRSSTHTTGTSENYSATHGTSESLGGNAGIQLGSNTSIFHANLGGNVEFGSNQSFTSGSGTSVSNAVAESASSTFTDSASQSIAQTKGSSVASSATRAAAKSVGHAVANSLGKAISESTSRTRGLYKGGNLGANFGANFARSSNVSATVGKGEGIHQSFTNYTIKHTLEVLEAQMKRLDQSTALGMWDFAAYVISEDQNVASNVAHSYLALTQGENSYLSRTAVNVWRGDMGERSEYAREICAYLKELRHPIFGLNPALTAMDSALNAYPAIVTATTSLSGKELAYSLNFPKKSVAGFPVMECAEFGRNIVSRSAQKETEKLYLGHIFHMNHEEQTAVFLSRNSMASHTLITGSTGSGKSNTVYQLLQQAREQEIPFFVVEPAKGEYKDLFGMDKDVSVYGTNPYLSPMLHLNPFSFPKGIHVFEHLDRLVEIFNVCWPMYAAMPAVLKNAIEKSYEDCGWDLLSSVNRYGEELYPTFADVADNIRRIIDASEYDAENKGAYKGSLLTRLQSLTNGINGTIFVSDEIPPEMLFDRNIIVDLSRVGSSETKALLMGVLVLKLQEYRMTEKRAMNAALEHITVLEEAHHLLRRTSGVTSSDSADLLGKSVEMIANAIAEMRTYGEGFVIVDQAPGSLDMAAIRNTNTKIVMRLPDLGDRELVGRAANLDDDQIAELAKLPCGVAAVYQNEWVQPVLCQVSRFGAPKTLYTYTPEGDFFAHQSADDLSESLLDCIMNREILRRGDKADLISLKHKVVLSQLDSAVKRDFLAYLNANREEDFAALCRLLYCFLSAEQAIRAADSCDDLTEWVHVMVDHLQPSIKEYSKEQINLAVALILNEAAERGLEHNDLICRFVELYRAEGSMY